MLDELSYLPGVAGNLPEGPWLVISPHPDDETFGLGGALLLAAKQGVACDVLFLTSGEQGGSSAEIREQEAREAAARLGLRNLWFWRLPDRSLLADAATVERLAELIAATLPGSVFFPSPVEPHPDHRAASAIAWEALRQTGFSAAPWSYEISVQGPANQLIDITQVVAQKREIMDVYASQATQNHYTTRILGLNLGRAWSLPLDASHAEAFCAWPKQDKPLNALLLEMATHKLGLDAVPGISPTVSVIIRTKNRPDMLREAILSVAAQTYRGIELVVVNDGGADVAEVVDAYANGSIQRVQYHSLADDIGRAGSANAGLDLAQGEWMAFLDDDDTLDPQHIAGLMARTRQRPFPRAVYSGVRGVDAEGREVCVWNTPYRPSRLFVKNFLPIHAVLFQRSLLGPDLRFDTDFQIYEDWDFWTQLSRKAPLFGIPEITATYHLTGNSGAWDKAKEANGRLQYYRKWLGLLTAEELNACLLEADAQESRANGLEAKAQEWQAVASAQEANAARLQALAEDWEAKAGIQQELAYGWEAKAVRLQELVDAFESKANRRIHELSGSWEAKACQAQELAERWEAQAKHLESQSQSQAAHIKQLEAENAGLERDYQMLESHHQNVFASREALLASTSWRLTWPLRAAAQSWQWCKYWSTPLLLRGTRLFYHLLPMPAEAKQAVRQQVLRNVFHISSDTKGIAAKARHELFSPQTLDKESVRQLAREELLRYLATDETLVIPQAPAGTPPRVSVVIVLYNQAGLTLECLRGLALCQDTALETIIIDNASTDETPALMARVFGVRYIRNDENLHFLNACNQAADYATGEYLLLLNNDAVLMEGSLARAVRRLDAAPQVGAVGGKILLYDGSLQEAGNIIWQDGSCLGYGRGMNPDAAPYQFARSVDYCSGAFLLTRRALFETLGRFDTRFAPAYYEETDYCVRLLEAGCEIVYDPAVQIRHFEFASSASNQSALELQRSNQRAFIDKHQAFLAQQAAPTPANILAARQRLAPGRKKILVIDDRVPHIHLGCGYPRANLIMHLLAEQGHSLTLYPLQTPHDDWGAVYQSLPDTVEVMLEQPNGGPITDRQADLGEFLLQRQGHYDIVLVSRPHNMQALKNLLAANPGLLRGRQATAPQLIYDAEAVFALREQIEAAIKGHPLPESVAAAKLQAELALVKGTQTVLTVSEAEAEHFRQTGYAQVVVLGHSLTNRPTTTPFAARTSFLFVGAMHDDNSPNADSMRWFILQVWPLIRAQLGESAQLDVVGYCQADSIRRLDGNGVHIHGAVDSLDPYFERSRVFVVPTRFAGGIPHKAHEAASRGVPMVVTPLIAKQLGWHKAVLSAASPAAFAEHCVTLFSQETAWASLREQGLKHTERDCSAERFRATLYAAIGTSDLPKHGTGAFDE